VSLAIAGKLVGEPIIRAMLNDNFESKVFIEIKIM